jgi:hypothetical protein
MMASLTILRICRIGFISALLAFTITQFFAADDPRVKAVNDFLWSRTQANNVIEYTYMTDGLKDHYRYDRKVKIRHESGRLVAFHFGPKSLELKDGGKSFQVDIVGTWENLNDHLIGEVDERDTFVETPRGWLADKMKFVQERPTEKAVVDGFGAPKDYRDPLRVLKLVMRAWADRDPEAAVKYVSVSFERDFKSPEEVRQFFRGASSPHHETFAIRRIGNTDRNVVEFDVDLYEMMTGDPRLIPSRVRVEIKKLDSGWFLDSWNTIHPSSPS